MVKNYTEDAIEQQVPPDGKILNLVAAEITLEQIKSEEVQSFIDKMYRVARGRQGDAKYPTMVGLAAPQIGVSKRVVIIGINAVGGGEQPVLREFINPEIIESSAKMENGREGCFSTSRVCGALERAKKVEIRALNRNGDEFTIELEGFPARVAQHEIDHLNGVRFPDRITDDNKLHWVEEHEFGDYRINWQNWKILCPRQKWLDIKSDNDVITINSEAELDDLFKTL